MRLILIVVSLLVALAANLAFWYFPNLPRALKTVYPGDQLRSVSFAPYRHGQDPLLEIYPSAAEVEEDVQSLVGRAKGLRTYSSGEGNEVVPALATKYGLEVLLGAWLGPKPDRNEREVAGLIELANKHPDSVKRLIVGNEVLLRRDIPRDQIIAYLDRVRAAVKQPVTYADVWEFWLKNPQVADHVDFVTVHFLPYWEDEPVGVDEAMEHIRNVYRTVKAAFPNKQILIGEVGWPAKGRSREHAIPSRWDQAEFINAFLKLADEEGFDYNLIEGFDQPWKKKLEGIVGGHWGVLDAYRKPKFDLKGPIVAEPHWREAAIIASVIAVLAVVGYGRRLLRLPAPAAIGAVLLAQLFATMIAAQALRFISGDVYNVGFFWELRYYLPPYATLAYLIAVPRLVLQVALAWALLHMVIGRLDGGPAPRFATAGRPGNLVNGLMVASAWLGAWATAWLAFDGRYRDFPVDDFLVASFGLIAARLVLIAAGAQGAGGLAAFSLSGAPASGPAPRLIAEKLMLAVYAVSIVVMLILEKLSNREALYWAGMAILMALPHLATVLVARRTSRPAAA